MFRVAVIVSVETPDAEEVNHLHVFFFFRADEAAHHLFSSSLTLGRSKSKLIFEETGPFPPSRSSGRQFTRTLFWLKVAMVWRCTCHDCKVSLISNLFRVRSGDVVTGLRSIRIFMVASFGCQKASEIDAHVRFRFRRGKTWEWECPSIPSSCGFR